MEKKMRKMLAFLVIAAACVVTVRAQEEKIVESELYHIQLDKLQIPRGIIQELSKQNHSGGTLADSRIYLEVFRNGTFIWRSPAKEVGDGAQELFTYNKNLAESSFLMFWESQDEIIIKAFMAENKAIVKATPREGEILSRLYKGAAVGAAVGSGIGVGVGGAVIGAGIGYLVGGNTSAVPLPVSGAREITTFIYPKADEFNLFTTQKENESPSRDSLSQKGNASLTLSGEKITTQMKHGELELQKKYLVRIPSVFLSSTNKNITNDAEYFIEIGLLGVEKPYRIDLGKRSADAIIPLEYLVILKNLGGESRIRIFRKRKFWSDLCVFEAIQGNTNGTGWVFINKVQDDNGSFIRLETYRVK